MNLLVATLGGSWAVIPEALGYLDPARLPLYPDAQGVFPVDGIWVATTDHDTVRQSVEHLREWWRLLGEPGRLGIWQARNTGKLDHPEALQAMRELIYRMVLNAREQAHKLAVSLAGGRKTMSADLQRAAGLFGCDVLLHVLAPERPPDLTPEQLAGPLPPEVAAQIMPVSLGSRQRQEVLELPPAVSAERFPLGEPGLWEPPDESLAEECRQRTSNSRALFGSYLQQLASSESQANWRSLYRLPPADIERLCSTRLGPEHLDWLRGLPKAELHCHVGGVLDLPAQRRVGRAVWEALDASERASALREVEHLLRADGWPRDWPETFRMLGQERRAACSAALLMEADEERLVFNLWGCTEPRRGLKERLGFWAYERPGELTGSAILGHPAAMLEKSAPRRTGSVSSTSSCGGARPSIALPFFEISQPGCARRRGVR
ncbi:MAG: CRISPR-associated ring nuclease [Candidatus Eremiobacterota bacterium]